MQGTNKQSDETRNTCKPPLMSLKNALQEGFAKHKAEGFCLRELKEMTGLPRNSVFRYVMIWRYSLRSSALKVTMARHYHAVKGVSLQQDMHNMTLLQSHSLPGRGV